MDNNKIIQEINRALTGNFAEDINYLQQKAMEYASNEQVTDFISKNIYMMLPEDEKEKFAKEVFSKEQKVEVELQRAAIILSANDKNKIDIAYRIVSKVIDEIKDDFKAGDTFKYYTFDNYMQFALYCNIFNPTKEVRRANYKYDDIYKMLGYILIEKGQYDEALEVLRKGISYNPVSVKVMFELGEVYKLQKEWDKFYDVSKRALEFAMTKEEIARAYRNIGFYFIEKKMYNEAMDLFLFSNEFYKSDIVENELKYIVTGSGVKIPTLDENRLKAMLEENQIQYGINEFILQIAYGAGQQAMKDGQKEAAKYYFSFIYDFDKDTKIKQILDSLN